MTLCIIQARLGSTRFPRKALADLRGKPVIAHVVERALQIQGVDKVVVACPSSDRKELQAVVPVQVLAPVVDEADVLGRYFYVAVMVGGSVIMRLTGDCPALNPAVSANVLRDLTSTPGVDLADNDVTKSGFPDGWDTEVFTTRLLQRAAKEARLPADREHVTPWMRRHADHWHTALACDYVPREKLSIDTPEDLARVEAYLARQEAA